MSLWVQIALAGLAGIGAAVCIALLPDTQPAHHRSGAARAPSRPAQLVALERLVVASGANGAVHAHAYLRPLLIEIASHGLAARGQTLTRMPDTVERALPGDGCGSSSVREVRSRRTGTRRASGRS